MRFLLPIALIVKHSGIFAAIEVIIYMLEKVHKKAPLLS